MTVLHLTCNSFLDTFGKSKANPALFKPSKKVTMSTWFSSDHLQQIKNRSTRDFTVKNPLSWLRCDSSRFPPSWKTWKITKTHSVTCKPQQKWIIQERFIKGKKGYRSTYHCHRFVSKLVLYITLYHSRNIPVEEHPMFKKITKAKIYQHLIWKKKLSY